MLRTLSAEEHGRLMEGAERLACDLHGDKVVRLRDGRMMKFFRRKRLFSTATLRSHAYRFADNVRRLERRAIATVKVQGVYRVPSIERHVVIYEPLVGESIRELAERGGDVNWALQVFAGFVARLHRERIYFRSLHFGNVLLLPDGALGLIDVADMSFGLLPLSLGKRVRNFGHLLRYDGDAVLLQRFGFECFFRVYARAANLSSGQTERFLTRIFELP